MKCFESLYQLGTEIMEEARVNNNILNNDQITEVAQTKQTAHVNSQAQECSSQQGIRVSQTLTHPWGNGSVGGGTPAAVPSTSGAGGQLKLKKSSHRR